MKILKLSFVFYAIFLCLGIALYDSVNFINALIILSLSLLLLFLSSLGVSISRFSFVGHFLLYAVCFLSLGFVSHHFYHWKQEKLGRTILLENRDVYKGFTLVIEEKLKPTSFDRYIASIHYLDSVPLRQKILLLRRIDTSKVVQKLSVGDCIFTNERLKEIPAPRNIGQFDYQRYMSNAGVIGQLYLDEYIVLGMDTSLLIRLKRWREDLLNAVDELPYWDTAVKSLFSAVVFGDRAGIDQEVLENFKSLGIMHILAISGLHVGIVFILLSKALFYLSKRVQSVIVTLFLWIFLVLAGFSPPVYRVVVMFTLYSVALLLFRAVDSKHIVGLTICVSLAFEPLLLFSISFQFSFIAVLSILYFLPYFENVYSRNRFVRYLQEIIFISSVVQIGLLPLQVYYFNSVSLGFMIGNLLAIPFITLFLIISILAFLTSFLVAESTLISGFLLNSLVHLFYSAIDFLEIFSFLFLKNLRMHKWSVICLLLMISVFLYRKQIGNRLSAMLMLCCINLAVYFTMHMLKKTNDVQAVVIPYTYRNEEVIVEIHQRDTVVSKPLLSGDNDHLSVLPLRAHKTILFVSEVSPIYEVSFPVDILVVVGKVSVNYDRVFEVVSPSEIVIHNSVPVWLSESIKLSCREKNIPFHDIREKGYYELML